MGRGFANRLQLVTALAISACNPVASGVSDSGSTRCVVQHMGYAAGAVNPGDSCQFCNPSLQVNNWTSKPDLTACSGLDGGTFCQLGQCVNACAIGGLAILEGTIDPSDPCQLCAPARALSGWSPNPSCNDGGLPDAGNQDAGTCLVNGVTLGAGELSSTQACQTCQPSVSTTSTSTAPDGTPCDAGGNVCIGGACKPGCYLEGALVAPQVFDSDRDQCCNPAISVGSWTTGLDLPSSVAIAGASSITSAAVTASSDQLVVGTSLGGVLLITELPDGGIAQRVIVADAGRITAVAAADVNGDGRVDLLYFASSSPALLAQNASQGFSPPKSWPGIQDGGGLWAENTPLGAQVLSFDEGYSQIVPSYLQPQFDANGQLFDSCRAAVDYCSPTGLAFGSFRVPKETDFVMTCLLPDGDNETLYGDYLPGLCGDGGWMISQFILGDFSTGEVYGPVVAAGDLNGDGFDEVVGGGRLEVDLLMNWGPVSGYFDLGRTRVPLSGGANVTGLKIADLRGDAGGTILAVDTGNSELDVFYPRPPYDAGIALTASYSTSPPGSGLAIGDFDGDGRPDVAVLSSSGVQLFHRRCP